MHIVIHSKTRLSQFSYRLLQIHLTKKGYASCGLSKEQHSTHTGEFSGNSQRHAKLKSTLEVFPETENASLLHTAFM